MSKPARRKRLPIKHTKPHKQVPLVPAKQSKKKFVVLAIVVLATAIPFGLGKYFEFNQPDPYDSGCYVYSAKHILDGAQIGVDEKPSAQLGTLLVNMLGVWLLGFNETGPELLQTILQAAALLLMFIAMRKLFGILPAAVGVIVASIYLSAPLIAKFGNVKEQHMIAFAVLGISCFVLYQLGGRFWYVILAGTFLTWAPLFKETGTSAIGAVGLFVLAQPVLKHRGWKKTGSDILLLLAGAALTIGPISLWLTVAKAPINYFPYSSFWRPLATAFQGSQHHSEHKTAKSDADDGTVQNTSTKQGLLMKLLPAYVRDSWQILKPEQKRQAKLRVLRWYRLLILPIVLAAGAIAVRIVRMIRRKVSVEKKKKRSYDRFVLLFAVWWLLDMGFVWISPRSYEQYYLPLNASAAMLGGYLIATYAGLLAKPANKNVLRVVGVIGLLFMIGMSWHIFFGIEKSPHSGVIYRNSAGEPEKRRGYAQKFKEVANRRNGARGSWEVASEYIRGNSLENDKIYVWGWVPGIYVQAQRLSSVPNAFEGTMHTMSPAVLSKRVEAILSAFEKEPPRFIVDTHKLHFPWDRPPLELWPILRKGFLGMKETGFLPANKLIIDRYDAAWSTTLRVKIEPDEAERFMAMKPFREFVMNNYSITRLNEYIRTREGGLYHPMFRENALFERK